VRWPTGNYRIFPALGKATIFFWHHKKGMILSLEALSDNARG